MTKRGGGKGYTLTKLRPDEPLGSYGDFTFTLPT